MPSTRSTPAARADDGSSSDLSRSTRSRRIASALLGVEAVGLAALATTALVNASSGTAPTTFALALAAFLLLFAVLVGVAAVSLVRHGRFGVGYGITWQMFQALVAATMLRASMYLVGAAALVLAIAAFVLLFDVARNAPPASSE